MRLGDWARLRVQLIWAYEGVPAMPHHAGTVETGTTTAWLLRRGSVKVKTASKAVIHARAGQWIFPTAHKTAHDFTDDAEILSLLFKAHWPDDRPLYRHTEPVVCSAATFPELTRTARRVVRLARTQTHGPGSDILLLTHPASLQSWLDLSRAMAAWTVAYDKAMAQLGLQPATMGGGDPRVAQAQRWIETLPVDVPFDEPAAAKSVGLSPSQLARLFVARTGMTPRSYRESRRVDVACQLLRNPEMSVKQVAYSLGFSQLSHFSNWFRKQVGKCPRDFRRPIHPVATDRA